jgi:hypothetical protein
MRRDDPITPKEQQFVQAFIRLGGRNATEAALQAGYSPTGNRASARELGSRLLRRPRVMQAIKEATERNLRAGVVIGASVLEDLAKGATSESVRLQAALALLDRGGMQLANRTEHHHVIEDQRSDAELRAHILELSRSLGLVPVLPADIVQPIALANSRGDVEDVQSIESPVADGRSIYD